MKKTYLIRRLGLFETLAKFPGLHFCSLGSLFASVFLTADEAAAINAWRGGTVTRKD